MTDGSRTSGTTLADVPERPADTPSTLQLSDDELRRLDVYWRAANYLSVGQIYLLDNPLLRAPLRAEHVKPRLLGHWGTTPGLNFLYAHFSRVVKAGWRGPRPRSIRTSRVTRRACAGSSGSSRSPAAWAAT